MYKNQSKFGIFNGFSNVIYSFYPLILADFSMAEKATIVYAYSVILILKLRSFRAFNVVAFAVIKDYAIFF